MSDGPFKVQTTTGVLVDDNKGYGFTEESAEANAAQRNTRAEKLGIEARYEAVPRSP